MDPDWPRDRKAKILPRAYRPPGEDPGKPFHYATAMEVAGVAIPVLAKSYDGRPVKIEGNPEHPASRGAAGLLAQASVLEVYDPDRSAGPCRFQGGAATESAWDVFQADVRPAFDAARTSGGRLAVLAEASSSPTLARAREVFLAAFPGARWFEWEPLTRDAAREGARLAFGRPLRAHYRLARAEVIASFDDDFLMSHPDSLAHARDFAERRRADGGDMSRFYAVESSYSVTGSQADHRRSLPPGAVPQAVWALAAQLVLDERVPLPAAAGALRPLLEQAHAHGEHLPFVARMAKDLASHPAHGLITCGPSQPAGVHALVAVLNEALGNAGSTVIYTEDPDPDRPSHAEAVRELADRLGRGVIDTVVVLGGNPVHDAPADVKLAEALARATTRIHLSLHRNETSQACTWHVPRAHYLEAWSDARSWDGTWTLTQPLLIPLFGGRTPAELLTLLAAGQAPDAQALVRAAYDAGVGGGTSGWERAVHDGFVAGTAFPAADPALSPSAWTPRAADFEWTAPAGGTVELAFLPDACLLDGRFANNAWLQELPDPVTKLTWDNALLLSPATAKAFGVTQGEVVRLSRGDRAMEAAVYLLPGQAAGSAAIALGYGRRAGGHVAVPERPGREGGGFDAYPLRTTDALWTAPGVSLARTGATYALVSTQSHHAIFNPEQGRGQARRLPELYREATLAEFREHPDFAKHRVHHPPLESLWKEHQYPDRKWGMTIDLSTCIGCAACVVACQAENNTAVVGKPEVARGREMHWIRIDRYFSGDPEDARMLHQPVTCHQCENAPCEQVCPVAATVHSHEGLNDMVYNRCVGTRYCSNNCPYKVRRFNWFNNSDNKYNRPELFRMQRNPDVTVRARGVMEKCTYCVQRIKAVTIPAKNERRPLKDGEIVPACAQTCPTQSIVFGDLNDPASRVRKAQDAPRSYAMLAELNVKPRTQYLAKVWNPADGGESHGGDHHASATHAGGRG
jgi:molybdopterin-containing oxidoreductase family iron-sulfur binding subunit